MTPHESAALGVYAMTVRAFTVAAQKGRFGENDTKWFPAWLRRYAEFKKVGESSNLPLTRESAVEFCLMLKGNQIPAWQRRQADRGCEFIRRTAFSGRRCHKERPISTP